VLVVMGCGTVDPPLLEMALQHLRMGQPAEIKVDAMSYMCVCMLMCVCILMCVYV